jgi:hypothetical protein
MGICNTTWCLSKLCFTLCSDIFCIEPWICGKACLSIYIHISNSLQGHSNVCKLHSGFDSRTASFESLFWYLQWCLCTTLTKNDFFVHVRVQVGPARGYVGSIRYHATNATARFRSRHPFLHIVCQCLLQGWWHASMSTLNPKLRALTLDMGCNQILMNQFPVLQGCAIVCILFLLIIVLSVGWQEHLEHKNRSFQLWPWIHQMPYDL